MRCGETFTREETTHPLDRRLLDLADVINYLNHSTIMKHHKVVGQFVRYQEEPEESIEILNLDYEPEIIPLSAVVTVMRNWIIV